MNDDRLRYAELVELLIEGAVGVRRNWAAILVLRMLETRGGCHYRPDVRVGGEAKAQAALASLRMALAALSPQEQGFMLRVMLMVPWEQMRRDTGLSLRLPEILAGLSEEVGASVCVAAARSVVEHGQDAVGQYPLEGLLPEIRTGGCVSEPGNCWPAGVDLAAQMAKVTSSDDAPGTTGWATRESCRADVVTRSCHPSPIRGGHPVRFGPLHTSG